MKITHSTLVAVALAIFAGALWLFWPCTKGEFLKVDDQEYLRQAVLAEGLTWNAVKWAFTSTDIYYQPLVRLSHVLDYQIWGRQPAGHHAVNVVLHAVNAVLVFGFLWTLLGSVSLKPGERLLVAGWTASIFAIHPLQTESVAWMAVRTQLLCTTWGISCLWAYVSGARRWVVGVLYGAALLCKPTAVSLPFVMLALDLFPLRRQEKYGWKPLLEEKAVFIVLAGLVAVVTVFTELRSSGPLAAAAAVPLPFRAIHVLRLYLQSLAFYPLKLDLPSHLSPYYFLDVSPAPWTLLAAVLLSAGALITVAVVMDRRHAPLVVAALAAYVALVLPTSTPIPRDRLVVAMRYAYEAMLPVLLLTAAAGVWFWRRSPQAVRGLLAGLIACQAGAFALSTRSLIPVWYSDETMRRATVHEFPGSEEANRDLATELADQDRGQEALAAAQRAIDLGPQVCEARVTLSRVLSLLDRYPEAAVQGEEAVRLDPTSARAHFSCALALMKLGKTAESIDHYQQAVRLDPRMAEAHCNLGLALAQTGRTDEALGHLRQAVAIRSTSAEFQSDLGMILEQKGKTDEAVTCFLEALRLDPQLAEAHCNLAIAMTRKGRLDEAISQYQQALRLKPTLTEAHCSLGIALAEEGRLDEAIAHYQQALRLNPRLAEAHSNLGIVLAKTGRLNEAIAHFEQALQIKPDSADAHHNLALALAQSGRTAEAIEQFELALRSNPDDPDTQFNLGLALAQTGRTSQAVDHFEQAVRLDPALAEAHCNLGVAYANSGRIDEAIAHFKQAVRLRPNDPKFHNDLGMALAQSGRLDEAIIHYQQALKIKPDFPDAQDNLRLAEEQLGLTTDPPGPATQTAE